MVIPYTVSRFFLETDSVKQLYFSVVDSTMVIPATRQIRRVLQARHRPESVYLVDNLTQLVMIAGKTASALTLVLLLIATVTLLLSGTGIMNIMLATVSARTQEIGIRKALGATNRTIRLQFLAEAVLISLVGGIIGVIIGLGLPFSLRLFTDYTIPISGLSAIIAIGACCLVGTCSARCRQPEQPTSTQLTAYGTNRAFIRKAGVCGFNFVAGHHQFQPAC